MTSNIATPVTIQEFRNIQEGVQTPGPKCNRCYYDIIWAREYSEQLFGVGKNKPFEMEKPQIHICPKDDQGNIITRKGYTKDQTTNKVIWIGSGGAGANPQQQTFQPNKTPISSSITVLTPDIITSFQEQIQGLGAAIQELYASQKRIETVINNYMAYNPTEKSFNNLIDALLKYLPEPELKPITADRLAST
jgi:hypothetical protein